MNRRTFVTTSLAVTVAASGTVVPAGNSSLDLEGWEKIILKRAAEAGHEVICRQEPVNIKHPHCKAISLQFPKHWAILVQDAAANNRVSVYFGPDATLHSVDNSRVPSLWQRQYGAGAPETEEEILEALFTLLAGRFPPPPRGINYLGFHLRNFLETQGWDDTDLEFQENTEELSVIQMYAGEALRGGLVLRPGTLMSIINEGDQIVRWHSDFSLEGLRVLGKRLQEMGLQGPGKIHTLALTRLKKE